VPSRRTALRIIGTSVAAGPARAMAGVGTGLRGAPRTAPARPIGAPALFPIAGGRGRTVEPVAEAVPAERRHAAGA